MQITSKQINNYWAKVTKTDSCWLWNAAKTKTGYGRFNVGSQWYLAHRVALMLSGNLPIEKQTVGAKGICILHKCDNPSCVNPTHLKLGTQKENMQDAKAKKRKFYGENAGENNPRATISNADARDIKQLLSTNSYSHTELAKKFNCKKSVIAQINIGRSWVSV